MYWHQYNLCFIHIVIIHLLRYLKFKSSNICIWMDGWMDGYGYDEHMLNKIVI